MAHVPVQNTVHCMDPLEDKLWIYVMTTVEKIIKGDTHEYVCLGAG